MRRNIRILEYDPHLDRTLGPSETYLKSTIPGFLDLKQFRVRANSSGFLLPFGVGGDETEKSSIIVGDSIAECLFMKEEFRIESILSAQNPIGRYLNGAISSATTLDIFNSILNKIIPTKPCKIFFMAGVFDGMIHNKGFYSPDVLTCTTSEPMGKINIANNFLVDRAALLGSMFEVVSAFDIELFVGTFSHRHNPLDPHIEFLNKVEESKNIYCLINSQTRELAMESNAKLIDLERLMYDDFDMHYDNHHLTPKGSLTIANYLLKAGF